MKKSELCFFMVSFILVRHLKLGFFKVHIHDMVAGMV